MSMLATKSVVYAVGLVCSSNIGFDCLVSSQSYHIADLKLQNHLKVGTDKPKLKVKMQSVSDDDVRKRLLEKPHFELVAKGVLVFRLGRCYIFWQGVLSSSGQQLEKHGYRRMIGQCIMSESEAHFEAGLLVVLLCSKSWRMFLTTWRDVIIWRRWRIDWKRCSVLTLSPPSPPSHLVHYNISTSNRSVNQSINQSILQLVMRHYVSLKETNCRRGHHLWLGREWKSIEICFEADVEMVIVRMLPTAVWSLSVILGVTVKNIPQLQYCPISAKCKYCPVPDTNIILTLNCLVSALLSNSSEWDSNQQPLNWSNHVLQRLQCIKALYYPLFGIDVLENYVRVCGWK